MKHYFSRNNEDLKSNPTEIAFRMNDKLYKMYTDNGVFSKKNLDYGTRSLLESIDFTKKPTSILDVGCGYGAIGIILSKEFEIKVDMIDVNERAIKLANKNSLLNNSKATAFYSDIYENVNGKYDVIISNPPIRAGKEIIYKIFSDSVNHLYDGGEFWTVINKKHGAISAIKKLEQIFKEVQIVNKKSGFFILKCQ